MAHGTVPANGRGFDVCVVGSFMKDLVARAPRRPDRGETLAGTGFAEFLGGKGLNQAVAAARSGARVCMVGRLGDDGYGREFRALLADERIDAAGVRSDPVHGTGVGLPVVEPDGTNSIIIVPRANTAVRPADVAGCAELIERSRVLAVQLELPLDAVLAALDLATRAGTVSVLNPAPCSVTVDQIAGRADVLIPNEVEAEQLTGLDSAGAGAERVARRLAGEVARRGCVLTLGARGAVVAERGAAGTEVTWIPTYPVETVDTVGAGDAFCGALTARLAAGDDLVTAARTAAAAGALATTVAGAVTSMPTVDRIRELRTAKTA